MNVRKRIIPCYKPNENRLYFKKCELEDWMMQNRCKSMAEIESEERWKWTQLAKTLDVSTQVRLVVNDSTSKGYKMSYTFLDVKADSVGDNFRDKMMTMVAERTAKSVIGTTIILLSSLAGRIQIADAPVPELYGLKAVVLCSLETVEPVQLGVKGINASAFSQCHNKLPPNFLVSVVLLL